MDGNLIFPANCWLSPWKNQRSISYGTLHLSNTPGAWFCLTCRWFNGVLACKSYAFQIQQDINKYTSFSVLPRDISQLIFNDLVCCHCLSDASIEAFRDCALQVINVGFFFFSTTQYSEVFFSHGYVWYARIYVWEIIQEWKTTGWMSSLLKDHLYFLSIFLVLRLQILG